MTSVPQYPTFYAETLPAGEDLSAKQFHFVKKSSGTYVVCDAATDLSDGVLQNKPELGEPCEVIGFGTSKVIADAAITSGAFIGTSADGQSRIRRPWPVPARNTPAGARWPPLPQRGNHPRLHQLHHAGPGELGGYDATTRNWRRPRQEALDQRLRQIQEPALHRRTHRPILYVNRQSDLIPTYTKSFWARSVAKKTSPWNPRPSAATKSGTTSTSAKSAAWATSSLTRRSPTRTRPSAQ